jgi:hypothetical protein
MSERKDRIRSRLISHHDESWPILQALAPEQSSQEVYSHGTETWSVKDVLAHLADSESGLQMQIRRLMSGEDGVPADFDLARWNRSAVRRRADLTLDELRDQIQRGYAQMLELLDEIDESALDMRGIVSTGEVLSVQDLLLRVGDHRLEHASDIRRSIEGEA